MSANPKKWSNTLKQFVGNLPTNCLNVFDHFVGFALKVLRLFFVKPVAIFHLNNAWLYLKEIDNGKMVVVCIWYKYMILKLKFVFNLFQLFTYFARYIEKNQMWHSKDVPFVMWDKNSDELLWSTLATGNIRHFFISVALSLE